MVDKRGQSLSINVIIVAALALIVLVVLVVIFTGRMGVFESGVSKEGNAELVKYKSLSYDDCHPGTAAEQSFLTAYTQATSTAAKDSVKSDFESQIGNCKTSSNSKEECEGNSGCKWK